MDWPEMMAGTSLPVTAEATSAHTLVVAMMWVGSATEVASTSFVSVESEEQAVSPAPARASAASVAAVR